ncbi:hypothetical protein D3C79_1032470 [compost metagenome]
MAVVDHVVVGHVLTVAGGLVLDLGGEPQAGFHPVIQLDAVGMDAVVFGVAVAVVEAGRVCAGIERQAECADSNEIAECGVHSIFFSCFC